MPFTPTHVVAVLPFWPWRRVAPFSAFVIGAMVPDLPLFFPIVDYSKAHSPAGVFALCLPMGIAIFFLFERVMRRPMLALLPGWLESRVSSKPSLPTQPFLSHQLGYWVGVAIAIVIGAYTHQVWDAFTHKGRWRTHLIPILNSSIDIGHFHVSGYSIFQHGSTFVGLPLLMLLAMSELSRTRPTLGRGTLQFQWKLLAGSLLCVVPACVAIYAAMVSTNAYRALFLTITRSGAILMVILLLYCLLFHLFTNKASDV